MSNDCWMGSQATSFLEEDEAKKITHTHT